MIHTGFVLQLLKRFRLECRDFPQNYFRNFVLVIAYEVFFGIPPGVARITSAISREGLVDRFQEFILRNAKRNYGKKSEKI